MISQVYTAMEERSAATLGGEADSSEEEGFDEGYAVQDILLTVRKEEHLLPPPDLQVTRRQKVLAGERLLLPPRCNDKGCKGCRKRPCLEAGEVKPCVFCSELARPNLCMLLDQCKRWTEEEARQVQEYREVTLAINTSDQVTQMVLPRAKDASPSEPEPNPEVPHPVPPAKAAGSDGVREQEGAGLGLGPEEEEPGREVAISVQVGAGAEAGRRPKSEMGAKARVKSLASRPFVSRAEEGGKYYIDLDLNQLSFPFKPEEYQIITRGRRMFVKAVHLNEESGGGNTPTRGGAAGQTYAQEFDLPSHVDTKNASCTITKENLAMICFGGEAGRPELAEYELKKTGMTTLGIPEARKDIRRADQETARHEDGDKDLKQREDTEMEAMRRKWQQMQFREIQQMQAELEASLRASEAAGREPAKDNWQPLEAAMGARAISPDRMEISYAKVETRPKEAIGLDYYKDRWNTARQEWRGVGMPRYPEQGASKGVHWRDPQTEDDSSFYSLQGTPPEADQGLESRIMPAGRQGVRPARFNPEGGLRPWDRGGDMFPLSERTPQAQFPTKHLPPSILRKDTTTAIPFNIQGALERTPLLAPDLTEHSWTSTPQVLKDARRRRIVDLQTEESFRPEPAPELTPPMPPSTMMTEPVFRTETQNTFSTPSLSPRRAEWKGRGEDEMGVVNSPVAENQLAQVLTLLTDRLTKPANNGQEKQPNLKLPTVTLPKCKRDSSDQTSARQWYTFKYSLFTTMAQHKMDAKILLLHYSTDPRLLPSSMAETFQTCDTLADALEAIDSRYPPVSSLHSELVKELLSYPPLEATSEKGKILRISKVLTSLEDFLRFFKGEPSLDLNREKVLVILHNLSGAQEYKQELVKEVAQMDRKRTSGQLYADSLKELLLRHRLMYVDLQAALSLVGSYTPSGKQRSAAYKEGNKSGTESKDKCQLCSGSHKAWSCAKELKKIRDGARTLPQALCRACLEPRESGHGQTCHIVRSRQNGIYYLYNNRCPKCSVHIRLCPCEMKVQKKVDPNQVPTPLKQKSAAMRTRVWTEEGGNEEEDDTVLHTASAATTIDELDTSVVFMTEEILVLGRENQTRKILVSYDTHGSSHHCTKELEEEFNWNEKEETRAVTMLTVTGEVTTQMAVFKLKLLTLQGMLEVVALEGTWTDSEFEPQLESNLAKENGITVPLAEEPQQEKVPATSMPRLILGCAEVLLFPKKVKTPEGVAREHPKLAVFSSLLSGNLLACGQLTTTSG